MPTRSTVDPTPTATVTATIAPFQRPVLDAVGMVDKAEKSLRAVVVKMLGALKSAGQLTAPNVTEAAKAVAAWVDASGSNSATYVRFLISDVAVNEFKVRRRNTSDRQAKDALVKLGRADVAAFAKANEIELIEAARKLRSACTLILREAKKATKKA